MKGRFGMSFCHRSVFLYSSSYNKDFILNEMVPWTKKYVFVCTLLCVCRLFVIKRSSLLCGQWLESIWVKQTKNLEKIPYIWKKNNFLTRKQVKKMLSLRFKREAGATEPDYYILSKRKNGILEYIRYKPQKLTKIV